MLYGKAVCEKQPAPNDGPEGFEIGMVYPYEKVVNGGRKMIRIFPDGFHPLDKERFYHTVTRSYFENHFTIVHYDKGPVNS